MLATEHRYLGKLFHGAILSLMLLLSLELELRPQSWPERIAPSQAQNVVVNLPEQVPDFASILDVDQKKQAFFDFLQPFVDAENARMRRLRVQLLQIVAKVEHGAALNRTEENFLRDLCATYEVQSRNLTSRTTLQLLLRRVDVIPTSLVLAQAANESAWGTSRFAQEGFNFFGQWCYTEGCGLVPQRRRASAYHEVKSFRSIAESVNAYFMNLNTFPSYQGLRVIRQDLRNRRKPIDGISLVEGLSKYSERGEDYINELRSMIHYNGLLQRDY